MAEPRVSRIYHVPSVYYLPRGNNATQLSPPFSAAISLVASGRQALPAAYHDRHNNLVRPGSDPTAFVHLDLDVSRLNKIHRYLWACGKANGRSTLAPAKDDSTSNRDHRTGRLAA